MPAIRPTPTTAPLVERQFGDIGGAINTAGGAVGEGLGTAVGDAGGVVGTAVDGASGAIETAANAPNAAISAGVEGATEKATDAAWAKFKENAAMPATVVACLLLVLFIVLGWRYYQKGKGKTICGKPRLREGGARDEEKE